MPRVKYCNGGHYSQESKRKTAIHFCEYRKQEKQKNIFLISVIDNSDK